MCDLVVFIIIMQSVLKRNVTVALEQKHGEKIAKIVECEQERIEKENKAQRVY